MKSPSNNKKICVLLVVRYALITLCIVWCVSFYKTVMASDYINNAPRWYPVEYVKKYIIQSSNATEGRNVSSSGQNNLSIGEHSLVVGLGGGDGKRISAEAPGEVRLPYVVQRKIPPGPLNNTIAFNITVPVSGQLGNRMFQYAALLGIAHLNGMKPFYESSSQLDKVFCVTHIKDNPRKNFVIVYEENFSTYDPRFESLDQQNTMLLQYFQSWKYFDFIRDTIRKEFTFKGEKKASAAELLQPFEDKIRGKVKVGVHVRRGDMLLLYHIRKGYHTAPASYVLKAMDYMRQKHGDVIFVFVTDDVTWCAKNFQNSDVVIANQASAEVHMAVLTSCDHVIMTVGTYGWWAGYLAGGDVVYYWDANQQVHDPPLEVELRKPEDFFPPHWVRLTG